MNFPENVKYSHDHEWIRVEAVSYTQLDVYKRQTLPPSPSQFIKYGWL